MSATMLQRTSARLLPSSRLSTGCAASFTLPLRRFESTEAATQPTERQPRTRRGEALAKVTRTHFLTLPLYENAELRAKMETFRDSLVNNVPPIDGLQPAIVVPKLNQSLEIRLGSFNIQGYPSVEWNRKRNPTPLGKGPQEQLNEDKPSVELGQIMQVLEGLKAPLNEILTANGGDGVLRVPLGRLRPLLHGTRDKFNPKKVNVLFLEATEGSATEPLRAVNDLIFEAFTKAGLFVDTPRASSLTLTLINTRNHAGKDRQRRTFDLAQLYESEAFKAIEKGDQGEAVDLAEPRLVNFGVGVVPGLYVTRIGAGSGGQGDLGPDGKLELPTA